MQLTRLIEHFGRYEMRLIAVSMSRLLGMTADAADIDREERRHRLRYRLTDDDDFAEWCESNDVTPQEFRSLMEEVALCRRLHEYWHYQPGTFEPPAEWGA